MSNNHFSDSRSAGKSETETAVQNEDALTKLIKVKEFMETLHAALELSEKATERDKKEKAL